MYPPFEKKEQGQYRVVAAWAVVIRDAWRGCTR